MWSSDYDHFATGTPTKGLFFWSLSLGCKTAEMHSDKLCRQNDIFVMHVAWSQEGDMIAASCIFFGNASLWNVFTGRKSAPFTPAARPPPRLQGRPAAQAQARLPVPADRPNRACASPCHARERRHFARTRSDMARTRLAM